MVTGHDYNLREVGNANVKKKESFFFVFFTYMTQKLQSFG